MVAYSKAIKKLWLGKCTIIEKIKAINPDTKVTEYTEQIIVQDEPCRISFGTAQSAINTATITNAEQQITLFIRQDLAIKAGSKITVTQNGYTKTYKASGEPRIYTAHQEIALEIEDDKT